MLDKLKFSKCKIAIWPTRRYYSSDVLVPSITIFFENNDEPRRCYQVLTKILGATTPCVIRHHPAKELCIQYPDFDLDKVITELELGAKKQVQDVTFPQATDKLSELSQRLRRTQATPKSGGSALFKNTYLQLGLCEKEAMFELDIRIYANKPPEIFSQKIGSSSFIPGHFFGSEFEVKDSLIKMILLPAYQALKQLVIQTCIPAESIDFVTEKEIKSRPYGKSYKKGSHRDWVLDIKNPIPPIVSRGLDHKVAYDPELSDEKRLIRITGSKEIIQKVMDCLSCYYDGVDDVSEDLKLQVATKHPR